MRVSFTIILIILSVLLGGLAIVHTGESYREKIFGAQAVQPGEQLFDLKLLDQTRSIKLEAADNSFVEIKNKDNIWITTDPWEDRTDQLYITSLFKFTASLTVHEVIDRKGLNLDDFGLGGDNIRVTMRDKDGKKTCDFRIGRTSAWNIKSEDQKSTQPTIFIRLADKYSKGKIYVCSTNSADTIHALFVNQFERFRDHHAFHFNPKYLEQVRIQNEDTEIVLSQNSPTAGWTITKPSELRVDRDTLIQLFNDLARIVALKVDNRSSVTLPTAENDVSQAREVSIKFKDQPEEITLRIYPGNESGIALATVSNRPNTVFHLPLTKSTAVPGTTALNLMQTGVNDLRSKNMLHMKGQQLKTVIIRPGGLQDILLQRTRTTQWKILREDGWHLANPDALLNLIMAVTRDKITRFATDAATNLHTYGLDRPMLLLGFNKFNGDGVRLAIGRSPDDNKIYARALGKPSIWEISPETLGKISLYQWQWRVPHIWHIPKSDIRRLTIQRANKPTVDLSYNHFTEAWTSKTDGKDSTASLNPNRAKYFLNQITSLQASKWIGPQHPIAMPKLKKPDTLIQLHMVETNDNGEEIPVVKTLKIGHTQGGLIYFGKVDTIPVGRNSEHESSYFYLAPDVISKLYVNLFE